MVQTDEGDTFNADLIEATVQALTDEVGRLGYAFVDIQPLLFKHPENLTVDLTYESRRGRRSMSSDRHQRQCPHAGRGDPREFHLAEGDAFTPFCCAARQRLRNLGFFESGDVHRAGQCARPPDDDQDQGGRSRLASLHSAPARPRTAYSATSGLRERNLLGKGRTCAPAHRLGGRQSTTSASPSPTSWNATCRRLRLCSTADLQPRASFDETNTGGTACARLSADGELATRVRYTLRDDEIENVDNDASDFIRTRRASG